uniref:Uncharacterized protein n=1 Tax=Arundo donax TaxID=35708 RepID=A0A0A9ABG4_ARUDO
MHHLTAHFGSISLFHNSIISSSIIYVSKFSSEHVFSNNSSKLYHNGGSQSTPL